MSEINIRPLNEEETANLEVARNVVFASAQESGMSVLEALSEQAKIPTAEGLIVCEVPAVPASLGMHPQAGVVMTFQCVIPIEFFAELTPGAMKLMNDQRFSDIVGKSLIGGSTVRLNVRRSSLGEAPLKALADASEVEGVEEPSFDEESLRLADLAVEATEARKSLPSEEWISRVVTTVPTDLGDQES